MGCKISLENEPPVINPLYKAQMEAQAPTRTKVS